MARVQTTTREAKARRRRLKPSTSPPSADPSTRSLTWIAVSFTDFDRAVIDELFRIGGYGRLDEIVVAGLWQLAKQLDAPITAFSRRVAREK